MCAAIRGAILASTARLDGFPSPPGPAAHSETGRFLVQQGDVIRLDGVTKTYQAGAPPAW